MDELNKAVEKYLEAKEIHRSQMFKLSKSDVGLLMRNENHKKADMLDTLIKVYKKGELKQIEIKTIKLDYG